MAIVAYNDTLRDLLANVECVLTFDTAADFLGLTNGGLLCTTVNRTIIDLLEQNGDEQIITESLANYYEEHNEGFDGLEIPEHLQERFEKYKVWAMEYYEE